MRNLNFLLLLCLLSFSEQTLAFLSMELTRGVSGAIPIAVVPFALQNAVSPPQDIANIIGHDLQNSGRFKVYGRKTLTQFPSDLQGVSGEYFRKLGTDNIVIGKITALGRDRYEVNFQLLDTYHGTEPRRATLQQKWIMTGQALRAAAHHISDLIYQQLTGTKGIFSTKLAYVVVQKSGQATAKYTLEVSDQDGYNPRPLLISYEPIMSPAWSPNGKQIAYVSFENQRAAIYVEEVATGFRKLLSVFPGINGAPAFSPDGKKMALVLSKSGSPNIYVMDISSRRLSQITYDASINTEPAWSKDGKSLLFTSNRSGSPQIYQVRLASGAVSRVSYAGDYNARASFSCDGKTVSMIHRASGIYNIGILNLDSGTTRILTTVLKSDSASPSLAPNGSMILYDMVYRGQNVLAMVSVDGRVQLVLPARQGEAQDPAWSPFLS